MFKISSSISDPVYRFNEIMDRIDLKKHLAVKQCGTGRPRCDSIKLRVQATQLPLVRKEPYCISALSKQAYVRKVFNRC